MIIDYWRFASHNWKHLMFGVLLITLSCFGQTFYISLFGEHLRTDFELSNTGFGTIYAIATIASAFTLTWVGRWIDKTSVERFTAGVALLLATACTLMAVSPNVFFLGLALYLLRLGGQGLMVHTAQTTMARAFHSNRGKALSITALGFPVGEAILPILVVSGMLLIGWRMTWLVGAATVIAGTWVAVHFLPKKVADAKLDLPKHVTAHAVLEPLVLWKDKRLLFTLPALLTTPFVATGIFFHQANLANEKGWSLTWIATCFVGYAAARAISMLAIGPVIDRFGAVRLLPFFLTPLLFTVFVLAVFSNAYAVPFYLAAMGISAGISSVMATSVWVELYGTQQLARVRSSVAAADVVASGLSPVGMGWLLDHGVPLSKQALFCIVSLIVVSLLSRRVGQLVLAQAKQA